MLRNKNPPTIMDSLKYFEDHMLMLSCCLISMGTIYIIVIFYLHIYFYSHNYYRSVHSLNVFNFLGCIQPLQLIDSTLRLKWLVGIQCVIKGFFTDYTLSLIVRLWLPSPSSSRITDHISGNRNLQDVLKQTGMVFASFLYNKIGRNMVHASWISHINVNVSEFGIFIAKTNSRINVSHLML